MTQYTAPSESQRQNRSHARRRARPARKEHDARSLTPAPRPARQQHADRLLRGVHVFCDWFSFKAQLRRPVGKVNDGFVLAVKPDGEKEWETARRMKFTGSHSTTVQLRCDGVEVELSGNVGRYGRRDNVSGAGVVDCLEIARRLVRQFTGGEIDDRTLQLSRVDLTTMLSCGSPEWRTRVQRVLSVRRVGRRMLPERKRNGNLIWPGTARRVSLYDKAMELRDHSKGKVLDENLLSELDVLGVLRLEIQLRRDWLRQHDLRRSAAWNTPLERLILHELMEDLRMHEPIDTTRRPDLKVRQYTIWLAWRRGDLSWAELVAETSRPTAYRIRATIREATGDDIRCVPPASGSAAEPDVPVMLEPWHAPPEYRFESPVLSSQANNRITAECTGYRGVQSDLFAPLTGLDANPADQDTRSSAKRRRSRCT